MKNLLLLLLPFLFLGQAESFAQCNPDVTPPVAVCVGDLTRDVHPVLPITVTAAEFNSGSYDACDPSNMLNYFIELAPQSSVPPSTTELSFNASQIGDHTIVLWVVDASGNASICMSTLHLSECTSTPNLVCNNLITVDLGPDNTYELFPQEILEGGPYCDYSAYTVRIDQDTFAPSVLLTADDIGIHQVSVAGTGAICWGELVVEPGMLNTQCPQLHVDLATNAIRPCFIRKYSVYYANGSTITVPDSYVELTLDDQLAFQNSSIPETSLGNNRYRFETGTLTAGQSGRFEVLFKADCDAIVGATHCSEARIFPNVICNPQGSAWTGPVITVEGHCVNDTVQLQINNIGTAASSQTLGFVVVEDVLMRNSGPFSLPAGESMLLAPIAGTGATIRLEAQQDPNYPYGGTPAVAVEGCGGLTPGMVTIFPTENSDPAISVDCRESVGSFDPNDKLALPKGFGEEHLIEKNTVLNYMIRFQNTGTDTAYKVVLVDSLTALLNPQTLRLGAASHAYDFDLLPGNILRITFDNINLPHQAVDEDGSQGFVQFAIQQTPDLADGSRIENSAAIYFDFNAPVITNTTLHTVGSHFVASVSTDEVSAALPTLYVYPNPGSDRLYFEAPGAVNEALRFVLTDALGRSVVQRSNVSLPMLLDRGGLQAGSYYFQFAGTDGRAMWAGKIMVR